MCRVASFARQLSVMENKLKHLEFIQAVINRMANTSFLLKGWSITIIAGLFAFSAKENERILLAMALILTGVFWFLDTFFLWQERLFRVTFTITCELWTSPRSTSRWTQRVLSPLVTSSRRPSQSPCSRSTDS